MIILLSSVLFSTGTIHFVYNANDDFFSVLGDFFHKSLSPNTYNCDLCQLTYGPISKKKQWKKFLTSLEYNYTFIYKNQNNQLLNNINSFPIILFEYKNDIEVLLSTNELNDCKNLDELISKINEKLNKK